MAHSDDEQITNKRSSQDASQATPQGAADQPNDTSLVPTQPKAGALVPLVACPHCGEMMPTHMRRCPHCGRSIPRGKRIARPKREFAGEPSAPWTEAAERVSELGGLAWETDVHPVNEATHPITGEHDPPPFAEDMALVPTVGQAVARHGAAMAASVPVRHGLPIPALALSAAMLVTLGVLFFGLLLPRLNSSTPNAAQIAAATHDASKAGHSTAPNGPGDGTLPPTATTAGYPGLNPTSTPHAHSTPIAHRTPTPQPTSTPTSLPTATPTPMPPQLVMAINAGSKDAYGNYSGDMDVQGGNTYSNPYNAIDTSRVTNPAPEPVYQSERWGVFTYTLGGLQPGAWYTVRLHFAEIYFRSTNQRVFNVMINNQYVLNNFDIVAAAGGPDIAIVEAFPTQADGNGNITINFLPTNINWPKLSGLELYTDPNGAAGG